MNTEFYIYILQLHNINNLGIIFDLILLHMKLRFIVCLFVLQYYFTEMGKICLMEF